MEFNGGATSQPPQRLPECAGTCQLKNTQKRGGILTPSLHPTRPGSLCQPPLAEAKEGQIRQRVRRAPRPDGPALDREGLARGRLGRASRRFLATNRVTSSQPNRGLPAARPLAPGAGRLWRHLCGYLRGDKRDSSRRRRHISGAKGGETPAGGPPATWVEPDDEDDDGEVRPGDIS